MFLNDILIHLYQSQIAPINPGKPVTFTTQESIVAKPTKILELSSLCIAILVKLQFGTVLNGFGRNRREFAAVTLAVWNDDGEGGTL